MRSVELWFTRLPFSFMHLLYLDDAGSAANKDESYLILGGVSVFEAQADWLRSGLINWQKV